MKRWAIVALCLAVQPVWAAEDTDPLTMTIDAGRLGVMMDQSQRMLGLPDDPAADGSTETPVILRGAVRQYQRLLPVACGRHAVTEELCERAFYAPRWLDDTATPSPDVLRTRIDEATDHVAPLWNALCERQPKDHDESLCQLE